MSINSFEALATANQTAADTFLQASKIYLESTERLVSLNLSTLRNVVEGSAAVANSLGDVRSVSDLQDIQSSLTPLLDATLAYSRSVQEIAARTQEGMTGLMNAQLSGLDIKSSTSAAWSEALDLFSRSAQQMATAASAGSTKLPAATAKAANLKPAKKAA